MPPFLYTSNLSLLFSALCLLTALNCVCPASCSRHMSLLFILHVGWASSDSVTPPTPISDVDSATTDHLSHRTLLTDHGNDSSLFPQHPSSNESEKDPIKEQDVTEKTYPPLIDWLSYGDHKLFQCLQEEGHLTAFTRMLSFGLSQSLLSDVANAAASMKCVVTAFSKPEMGFDFTLYNGVPPVCSPNNYVNISDGNKIISWYPNCKELIQFRSQSNSVTMVVSLGDTRNLGTFSVQLSAVAIRLQVVHVSSMEGKLKVSLKIAFPSFSL